MPITKTQLKQIAAKAWSECYENFGYDHMYHVIIKGDGDKIKNILDEFADEMNERDDNRDYTVCVDRDGDKYMFSVFENDNRTACYEFDEREPEDEIVADDAKFSEKYNPAPEDVEWNKIRDNLLKPQDGEFLVDDHLALALNYGNCLNQGRHEKTNDEDWILFLKVTNLYSNSSQDVCYDIYERLDAERIAIYWSL